MRKATLIYSDKFAAYDLGPQHPLRPERVDRTFALLQAYKVLPSPGINWDEPTLPDKPALLRVHSEQYLDIVRALDAGKRVVAPWHWGFGTGDNPIFPGMYEASALTVGGSLRAADRVMDGESAVAFNIGGGLHHAHRQRAAGFCVFNDPAIAIAHLLARTDGAAKIVYIDIDAHHGDGVQEAFYESNRVLTISLHETGRSLFPHSGEVEEMGARDGVGFAVNVPLAPYTDDETYLGAFREVVPPLVQAFAPDFIVSQLGADTHHRDPLTHLGLTTAGYLEAVKLIGALPGKWVALGGGGYDLQVTPRAWALAFGAMAGVELPDEIPPAQAALYPDTGGRLRDPAPPDLDPGLRDEVQAFARDTVAQVRRLIFPHHRL